MTHPLVCHFLYVIFLISNAYRPSTLLFCMYVFEFTVDTRWKTLELKQHTVIDAFIFSWFSHRHKYGDLEGY